MAEFIVTAEEVRNKAAELRRINEQYKTTVDNLKAEESRLNGMWEGEAHDVFDTAFKNDSTRYDNFFAAIEDYCVKLEAIAVNYNNAEARNVATAQGNA